MDFCSRKIHMSDKHGRKKVNLLFHRVVEKSLKIKSLIKKKQSNFKRRSPASIPAETRMTVYRRCRVRKGPVKRSNRASLHAHSEQFRGSGVCDATDGRKNALSGHRKIFFWELFLNCFVLSCLKSHHDTLMYV